jgi:hypothetical protein
VLWQETDHTLLTLAPPRVTANVCCPPAGNVTLVGLIFRVVESVTVTDAVTVFVVSACEIAVTMMLFEGSDVGAV